MQPFSTYMDSWLYGEEGYYASMPDIGKDGDFYTAVSTSMFFGGSIAKYLMDRIEKKKLSPSVAIIEIGAHKGYLLADMVQFIFTLKPKLLKSLRFIVVEPLEKVRKSQRDYFLQAFGDKVEVEIVASLDDVCIEEAFIVANELFDAISPEVIDGDTMLYIQNHTPVFKAISEEVRAFALQYDLQKGEVPIGYKKVVKSICASIKKFEFICFDYGDKFSRGDFSLRVYKKHHVYPFFELTSFVSKEERLEEFFQKSDITYDVNFEILIDIFEKNGAKLQKFSTQMVALSDFGIASLLEILRNNVNEKTYAKEVEKVKQLLLPNFLGERFKMVNFIKE